MAVEGVIPLAKTNIHYGNFVFLRCHDPKDWSMEALDNACVYVCVCGYRSSCQRCSVRKSVPAILLRKRLWHRCFPVNFATFLATTFHKEHLWWLLLWVWRIFILISHVSLKSQNGSYPDFLWVSHCTKYKVFH